MPRTPRLRPPRARRARSGPRPSDVPRPPAYPAPANRGWQRRGNAAPPPPSPIASASRAKRPAMAESSALAANDMGAARTLERGARVVEVRDDRALAARLDVADRGLNLGTHAALGKVTGALERLELAQRDGLEVALLRFAEIDRDALDRSEDEQFLQLKRLREDHGREVLVDHRLHALPVASCVAHHRDAAAAAGDHHRTRVEQHLDHAQVHDGARLGGGYAMAPAAAGVFHHAPALLLVFLRFVV